MTEQDFKKFMTVIDKGTVGKRASETTGENIQKMLEEIEAEAIDKKLNVNLSKEKILEQLLKEINDFKLIKDLKNDNIHHITNILAYYRQLKDNFPNSIELTTAIDALLSIKEVHPEASRFIDQLLKEKELTQKPQKPQVIKGKKRKGQPIVDDFIELLKAIKSTIADYKNREKATGMQDTFECEQYISLLRQYQYSLEKYKDRLNPKHLAEMHLLIENEIQHATDIIDYANSVDSGFTL